MLIMLIDGMGGGIGRSIADALKKTHAAADIIAVGTNSNATANMMKAGISSAATGENSVIYMSAKADIIIGPIGIILPNSMYGEISPEMAVAVASSPAEKILIPIQSGYVHIAGLLDKPLSQYVDEAVNICLEILNRPVS